MTWRRPSRLRLAPGCPPRNRKRGERGAVVVSPPPTSACLQCFKCVYILLLSSRFLSKPLDDNQRHSRKAFLGVIALSPQEAVRPFLYLPPCLPLFFSSTFTAVSFLLLLSFASLSVASFSVLHAISRLIVTASLTPQKTRRLRGKMKDGGGGLLCSAA